MSNQSRRASLEAIVARMVPGRVLRQLAPEREAPVRDVRAEAAPKRKRRSVHLRLEPEVFEFFFEECGGKGHVTRMQAVLRAYMEAKRR